MDDSNSMRLFIARDDKIHKPIVLTDIKEEAQYTYPSDFWKSSNNKPPSISIMNNTANQIYSLLMEDLAVSQWRDNVISTFIHHAVLENKELFEITLTEDWTPKGEPAIGKKDDKINPFSLITVTKDSVLIHPKLSSPTQRNLGYLCYCAY
ncbi:hypothetical protein JTE90_025541 [Oedothorax gibbosus]|uniref:Uncharacterized protein n=1 Tax=Oedothorax gibbosus TaxID=931172 RepID=A0AAV6TWT0_9ARAC|nr:hypothetical protein JTE90_025541 [Oedothorax gibbosus]